MKFQIEWHNRHRYVKAWVLVPTIVVTKVDAHEYFRIGIYWLSAELQIHV